MQSSGWTITDADKEVADRLQQKALMMKYLAKHDENCAGAGVDFE